MKILNVDNFITIFFSLNNHTSVLLPTRIYSNSSFGFALLGFQPASHNELRFGPQKMCNYTIYITLLIVPIMATAEWLEY